MDSGRRRQSKTTAEFEVVVNGSAEAPARSRLAYGLVKAAIDEAVRPIKASDAQFVAQRRHLKARTIESIYAGALATIEFMDAVNADGPTNLASTPVVHSRRQREALNEQVMEYLAAARNVISALTAPPSGFFVDCSKPSGCPAAPCQTQTIVERLKTLTERQRRVLELVADGLPNKVIAYKLGLCETTVKAHVSEILRKLCVYSRARAIVLLVNVDFASIFSSSAPARSGGP